MPSFNQQLRWQADLGTAPGGRAPAHLLTPDSLVIGTGSRVVSLDRFTGAQKHRHDLPLDPAFLGTFGGKIIVADDHDDSTLYVLDTGAGTPVRFFTLQGRVNWLQGAGDLLYAATDARIYRFGRNHGRWDILKQAGPGSMAPAVCSGQRLYCTTGGAALCFDLEAFSQRWWTELNGDATARPALDGEVLYLAAGRQKTVHALDARNGGLLWQSQLPSAIVQNLVVHDGDVYAPCEDSVVYVLDAADGSLLERMRQPGVATSPIVVNPLDGILYLPAGDEVLARAPDSGNDLSYAVGSWPYLLGTNASDVYVGGGERVYAIGFSEVLKQFSIDSTLLQDFEPTGDEVGHGTGLSGVPRYHTEVFLHNPDGTPLANTPVKLRSTVATLVSVAGETRSLGPGTPVGLTTDATGRLRIESEAADISTPPLLLWAPFLADGEEIVIYPDLGVHNQLAVATGEELATARDYAGNPILAAPYREDREARHSAAKALQSALGLAVQGRSGTAPPSPRKARRQRRRGIGAASEAVNAAAFFISDPSRLSPALELPNDWHMSLQPGRGSAFSASVTAGDVEEWAEANRAELQKRSLVGDLWEAIGKGAKVAEAFVYQVGDQILTSAKAWIDGAWVFFKDVVLDSVEKALKLVRGILNEIVEDIGRALEWLSFVFDWDAILSRHREMKETVLSNLDALGRGARIDSVKSAVSGAFGDLKLKLDDVFDEVRSGIGQGSFNADAQVGGRRDGSDARSTWLVQKLKGNAGPDAGGVKRSADSEPTVEVSLGQGVIDALNAFLDNVKDDLSEDLHQELSQVVNGFQSLSPSDVLAGALAAVLTAFQGIASMAVDVCKNVLLALLDLLKVLLQSGFLKDLLTAELPIPFVKDLYRYLTGETMSLLDVATLLIAIPVTIAERAAGRHSGMRRRSDPWGYFNTAYILWGMIDCWIEWEGGVEDDGAGMALLRPPLPWSLRPWKVTRVAAFGIGVPVVIQLLLLPDTLIGAHDHPGETAPEVVLWALPFAAVLVDVVVTIITKGESLARFEIAGQVVLLLLGLGVTLSLILFKLYNESFKKNLSVLSLLSNVFLNAPLVFKLVRNWVPDGVKAGVLIVAGIDFAANLVGGMLGLAAAAEA